MSDLSESGYVEEYFSLYASNSELRNVVKFFADFPDEGSDLPSIVGDLLRASLDEVIDMPRTGRFSLDELEKTEKTYIGTKVEILFRDTFGLRKGLKLDLMIQGKEVDVKNTIGSNWTIPSEAVDEICVLLQTNDNKSLFCFGVVVCRDRMLNKGKNRDGKRTISKEGKKEILWLVKDGALPKNFFLHLDGHLRNQILSPRGGGYQAGESF